MAAERILLVDDDDSVRTVAAMALQMLGGYRVLALDSGQAAVREAAGFAPDVLVLDMSMPGMSGPETLEALRAQAPLRSVPAIFLTARTQAHEVAHLRSLGAAEVVAKPFDPAQLCERVRCVLAGGG